jgi:hypothetical protein
MMQCVAAACFEVDFLAVEDTLFAWCSVLRPAALCRQLSLHDQDAF